MKVTVFWITKFFWHFFDESSNHGMHNSMIWVPFRSVAIQLISCQYSPMLFIPVCFGFQIALPFMNILLVLFIISKTLDWFDILGAIWLTVVQLYLVADIWSKVYHGIIHRLSMQPKPCCCYSSWKFLKLIWLFRILLL